MPSLLSKDRYKKSQKNSSKKLLHSFPLIALLSTQIPLSAILIEGEIKKTDLTSKYNELRLVFGQDAYFAKEATSGTKIIYVGSRTRFLSNLSISKMGLSGEQILILPKTIEPILIRNFGNSATSQWTLGINAEEAKNVTFINENGAIAYNIDAGISYSGKLVIENKEGAVFRLEKGLSAKQSTDIPQSLVFNNRGTVKSSTNTTNVGDGITARGEIIFNNFGSSSLAQIYLMSGDVNGSDNKFDEHSSLILHNEGTMISTASADDGDTTNVIEARGKAVIVNLGLIKGGIAGGSGQSINDLKGQGQFEIKNYGKILNGQTHDAIVITSASNSITNYGDIDSIRMHGKDSAVKIDNKGRVAHLFFEKGAGNASATLADGFAFGVNRSYESQGGMGISIENGGGHNGQANGVSPKVKLAGGRKHSFIALVDKGTELGKEYKIDHFFGFDMKNQGTSNSNQKIEFQDALGTKIETSELPQIILSNLKTADGLYTLKITATGFSLDVKPEQSFGHFRTLQSASTLSSFSTRLQSALARVMDSQSLSKSQGSTKRHNKPSQENKSSLTQKASFSHYLRLAQAPQSKFSGVKSDAPPPSYTQNMEDFGSHDWTSFILPYYSFSRFKPQDLSPIKTQMGGVFAGATKSFEHQILLGFHLGVEYQNSSLTQSAPRSLLSKMRASNWIYSLGLHSKIPLPAFKNSLAPFLRTDLSALLVQNTYSLSPSNEKTQELRKLSGGMILDFLAGAEFKTNFALFSLETGLSQRVLHLPKLSFTNFQNLDSQFYAASTLTPLHYLLQAQYKQDFDFALLTLSPRVKLGMQAALFGNQLQNSLRLAQGTFKARQSLDSLLGIFEAGLSFEFKKPLSFEINYLGEYGRESEGHSVDLKFSFRF